MVCSADAPWITLKCLLFQYAIFTGIFYLISFFLAEVLLKGDLTHTFQCVTKLVVAFITALLEHVDLPLYVLDNCTSLQVCPLRDDLL